MGMGLRMCASAQGTLHERRTKCAYHEEERGHSKQEDCHKQHVQSQTTPLTFALDAFERLLADNGEADQENAGLREQDHVEVRIAGCVQDFEVCGFAVNRHGVDEKFQHCWHPLVGHSVGAV